MAENDPNSDRLNKAEIQAQRAGTNPLSNAEISALNKLGMGPKAETDNPDSIDITAEITAELTERIDATVTESLAEQISFTEIFEAAVQNDPVISMEDTVYDAPDVAGIDNINDAIEIVASTVAGAAIESSYVEGYGNEIPDAFAPKTEADKRHLMGQKSSGVGKSAGGSFKDSKDSDARRIIDQQQSAWMQLTASQQATYNNAMTYIDNQIEEWEGRIVEIDTELATISERINEIDEQIVSTEQLLENNEAAIIQITEDRDELVSQREEAVIERNVLEVEQQEAAIVVADTRERLTVATTNDEEARRVVESTEQAVTTSSEALNDAEENLMTVTVDNEELDIHRVSNPDSLISQAGAMIGWDIETDTHFVEVDGEQVELGLWDEGWADFQEIIGIGTSVEDVEELEQAHVALQAANDAAIEDANLTDEVKIQAQAAFNTAESHMENITGRLLEVDTEIRSIGTEIDTLDVKIKELTESGEGHRVELASLNNERTELETRAEELNVERDNTVELIQDAEQVQANMRANPENAQKLLNDFNSAHPSDPIVTSNTIETILASDPATIEGAEQLTASVTSLDAEINNDEDLMTVNVNGEDLPVHQNDELGYYYIDPETNAPTEIGMIKPGILAAQDAVGWQTYEDIETEIRTASADGGAGGLTTDVELASAFEAARDNTIAEPTTDPAPAQPNPEVVRDNFSPTG